MAGNPKWHAFLHRMAQPIGEDEDGEAWLMGQIAAGKTVRACAAMLQVGRMTLERYIEMTDARKAMFEAARKRGASAMVDDAIAIVDEADTSGLNASAEISKAKLRADIRRWRAGTIDREQYGEQSKGININLTVNSLHLDALKHAGAGAHVISVKPSAAPAIEGEDYQVLAPPSQQAEHRLTSRCPSRASRSAPQSVPASKPETRSSA